jgi:hypothetical protein
MSTQRYDLVLFNFDRKAPKAKSFSVYEGDNLSGLNVVFCDPSPATRAREGSQWAIDLCRRIVSRAYDGRMFDLPGPAELSRITRNKDLRKTFGVKEP